MYRDRPHWPAAASLAATFLVLGALPLAAQSSRAATAERSPALTAPVAPLRSMVDRRASELVDVVELYSADRSALNRRWDADYSSARRDRMREFYEGYRARLRELDFDDLGLEGRIDYILLDTELRSELAQISREDSLAAEMDSIAGFTHIITELQEARRRLEPVDAPAVARALTDLARRVDTLRAGVERSARRDSSAAPRRMATGDTAARAANGSHDSLATRSAAADTTSLSARKRRIVAARSAAHIESARQTLSQWYRYYAGYDPMFTWWMAEPYKRADSAITRYVKTLRERVVGIRQGEEAPIIGDPIGDAALRADLALQLIPYTPEELLAIAEREFAWCEAEMRKASHALGFGDDWKSAIEKVKQSYVEPGQQPYLIRDLAREAIEYIEQRGLVTVPPLAKEVWRMEMMTPEAQRMSPFFLGGEVIRVSYPTDEMSHDDKLMSLRGNNPHFARATVHHELIPGHHLQGFMTNRYNSHRSTFGTPFWSEGWAFYWEMLLWDNGFVQTPEDKVGFLFWRMHRAARIIFSVRFHTGTMSPDEAVAFLVDKVGHERANAMAEVRRSVDSGRYPPVYQLAYMIGALQFRALHQELVGSRKMTNRQFHDTILQGGNMPVEMVRARLTSQRLARDFTPSWRFAGTLPALPAQP